jgi:tRNA G10  N-methylase Trm11
MQTVVEEIVKARLKDVNIKKLLDGAIIFETDCSYDSLNFFCFNNIFSVLDILENVDEKDAIENHIIKIYQQKNFVFDDKTANNKIKTFRVICSHANQLVPVEEKIKLNIEKYISQKTGLSCDRSRPDTEFWFLYRHEGFSVFMERRSRHRSFDKTLHKGELPPPLAYMLCRLANPGKAHVVLDPFCGYGAIPEQALKHFPAENVYAFDINNDALKFTRKKFTGSTKNCTIDHVNINNIFSSLAEKSIDRIITDPPWGMYEQAGNPAGVPAEIPVGLFYEKMVNVFSRLLKDDGIIVLLTARTEETIAAVSKCKNLVIKNTLNILLSGKKAAVFILTNVPQSV